MQQYLSNVVELASIQEQPLKGIESSKQVTWPKIPDDAFHGLVGRYIRKLTPHTEADPAAILLQFLIMYGNLIGRGPHFRVEADEHHLNLFAVLVGETAKGRKGVSASQAKRIFENLDPDWHMSRIKHGLSSGEGLIWVVRDPIEKIDTKTGELTIVDEGVDDKRLLILETEFASIFHVIRRDGNTLSAIVRNAWDCGHLSSLTKNSSAQATGAHISIIGHITKSELLRHLDTTETANGFGNRFLWICSKRSKCLPEGGASHTLDFSQENAELAASVEFARKISEVKRDDEARTIWADVYPELSEGKPGLLGSIIGRAEAQTMRLACIYALLDRSELVRAEHLVAALALWSYCEASARWIFGDTLGDPVADGILRALRGNSAGLTKNEICNLYSRHGNGKIDRALTQLLEQGLASFEKEPTSGRPAKRWRATSEAS